MQCKHCLRADSEPEGQADSRQWPGRRPTHCRHSPRCNAKRRIVFLCPEIALHFSYLGAYPLCFYPSSHCVFSRSNERMSICRCFSSGLRHDEQQDQRSFPWAGGARGQCGVQCRCQWHWCCREQCSGRCGRRYHEWTVQRPLWSKARCSLGWWSPKAVQCPGPLPVGGWCPRTLRP